MKPPPARIATERLVLRNWEPDDAGAFGELLAGSRDHFAAFIPFFLDGEPAERIAGYRAAFAAGESFSYAAFHGGDLIGGGGLFPRVGPNALEIGYHVRAERVRQGYASEIAAALVDIGFRVCRVGRLEMHIDSDNVASLGVAAKLGFVEAGYDPANAVSIFSRVRPASESSTRSA